MQTLKEHHFNAKFSKYEFWLDQIHFLGNVVSKKEVAIDPSEVEAVTKWPAPKNVIEMRSFSRITGYYQIFVEGFSKLTAPLMAPTRKGKKYE